MKRLSSKLLLLCTLVAALLFAGAVGALAAGAAKNVIVFIGDGMGFGAIQVSRNILMGPEGRFTFEQFPHTAIVTTHSLDNWVTDSAAAATAIATGFKTNNGMISMLPDGTVLPTILEAMQKAGKAVGVVVTNSVYDATPAAFTAHWNTRGGSEQIALQQFEKGLDVLLGGGRDQFLPAGVEGGKRTDGRNLLAEAEARGYDVVTDRRGLLAASGDRILGLFHLSNMTYQLDKAHVDTDEPTLAEMTAKALSVLAGKENGFFLLVEGSRIDHAAHGGDLRGVAAEMADFERAVAIAYEFAKRHGDTLIVVTADHDTMGLSATEPLDYERLKEYKASPEFRALQFKPAAEGNAFDEASIREVFATYAGIHDLTAEEIALIQSQFGQAAYKIGNIVGLVLASRANAGVVSADVQLKSASTGGHTANPVPLYAFGPGAEQFGGVMDNTEIAAKVAAAANVEWPMR